MSSLCVLAGTKPPCEGDGPTPHCEKTCESGYNVAFDKDRHYGDKSYSVRGVENVQTEIMTNGPVEGAFSVYEDFLAYKTGKLGISTLHFLETVRNSCRKSPHPMRVISSTGVYKHTSGKFLGGHAIKILGWGTEDNMPYWLVANSWNTDWGDKGGSGSTQVCFSHVTWFSNPYK